MPPVDETQTQTPAKKDEQAKPDDAHQWGRFRVEATPAVLATLRACAACASAPADVRAAAAAAAVDAEAGAGREATTAATTTATAARPPPAGVPWRLVPRACEPARDDAPPSSSSAARHVRQLLTATTTTGTPELTARLLLPSPPPPRPRPPELTARLQRLREMQEDQKYAAMLKDASPAEAAEVLRQMRRRNPRSGGRPGDAAQGGDDEEEGEGDALLPTTRLQLSFGLQVVVTMGAFFALGYYGGKAATRGSEAAGALLGTVGLVAALLLETSLFVVRSSPRLRALDRRYGHLLARKRDASVGAEGAEEHGEAGAAGVGLDDEGTAAAGGLAAGAAASPALRQRRQRRPA
jgi:hypothetical protein